MAITGTFGNYSPELAEAFEEAFEMAGVRPLAIGAEHIESALRSVQLMLNSEWSTLGVRDWMVVQTTQTVTAGDPSYTAPAGCVDILRAVCRRSSRDTPLFRISRADYLDIADKNIEGRPDRYWVEKLYNQTNFTLWRVPENSSDIIVYECLRQTADVGTMSNTLHMPPVALDCFHTGLAMRLALKFSSRERYQELKLLYGGPRYPEQYGGKLLQLRAATASGADVQFSFARPRR